MIGIFMLVMLVVGLLVMCKDYINWKAFIITIGILILFSVGFYLM